MKKELKKMKNENKLIVKADKSNKYYKMDVEDYSQLIRRDINKEYKKGKENNVKDVTKGDKKIAEKLKLEDRIFSTSKREAFLTLKDHKENFVNNKPTRLINPTKSEIGKISKKILESVRDAVKEKTNIMQWKNTVSVLQWFKTITEKQKYTFIQFDIVNFYPSITEKLLTAALDWATTFAPITEEQRKTIFHVRQNFLFNNSEPWVKKGDKNFDVPMGAYDSAEVCDIVGLYLLNLLKPIGIQVGLYRDDGLAISDKNGVGTEKIKKQITKIFKENGLKIISTTNVKIVNFLDVTLDLNDGSYKPYSKPDNKPIYVHAQSNHPPSIKKNVPKMINKRLSTLSSNEEIFNAATKPYEDALKESGYNYQMKYEEINLDDLNKKKKRNRRKRQHWFNPPHSDNLRTNIGEKFINIVKSEFTEDHVLHSIFNVNTVRLSYSCMPNMSSKISMHNGKVFQEHMKENEENIQNQNLQNQNLQNQNLQNQNRQNQNRQNQSRQNPSQNKQKSKPCNCRGGAANCPLGGKCNVEKSIVYTCKVTRLDNSTYETYTGLTADTFKQRLYGHNSDFNKRKHRNKTMLSKYIWYLKENNIPYQLTWDILGKAKSFNPVTGVCRLCLLEKYFIMFNPKDATLNSRDEIFNSCRHKWRHTLKRA